MLKHKKFVIKTKADVFIMLTPTGWQVAWSNLPAHRSHHHLPRMTTTTKSHTAPFCFSIFNLTKEYVLISAATCPKIMQQKFPFPLNNSQSRYRMCACARHTQGEPEVNNTNKQKRNKNQIGWGENIKLKLNGRKAEREAITVLRTSSILRMSDSASSRVVLKFSRVCRKENKKETKRTVVNKRLVQRERWKFEKSSSCETFWRRTWRSVI